MQPDHETLQARPIEAALSVTNHHELIDPRQNFTCSNHVRVTLQILFPNISDEGLPSKEDAGRAKLGVVANAVVPRLQYTNNSVLDHSGFGLDRIAFSGITIVNTDPAVPMADVVIDVAAQASNALPAARAVVV